MYRFPLKTGANSRKLAVSETVTMGLTMRETRGNFFNLLWQPLEFPCSLRTTWCTEHHIPRNPAAKLTTNNYNVFFLALAGWLWTNLGMSVSHRRLVILLMCLHAFSSSKMNISRNTNYRLFTQNLRSPGSNVCNGVHFLTQRESTQHGWKELFKPLHHKPALFSEHREEIKEYIECSKGIIYSSSSKIVFVLPRSTFVQMWRW